MKHIHGVIIAAILVFFPAAAAAQVAPAPAATQVTPEQLDSLQTRAFAAMDRGEYREAEALLRELIGLHPDNFVPYYNLACVLSLAGDPESALEQLVLAVERGFVDIHHLRRDAQLAAVRELPAARRLLDNWPTVLERHMEANLAQARRIVDSSAARYEATRDSDLRLAWLNAMDSTSFAQARADITRLSRWGLEHVFADLADPERRELDAWVVVVLPSPRDFLRWTVATFGPGAAGGIGGAGGMGIGGLYDHDLRRLVAQDLGPTLRHEFFHVLHWRSTTRLGQSHPLWIQEGLCSLVEEYEIDGEQIRPTPSWRTNIAKRLVNAGRAQPLRRLASMPRESFTGGTALANYAQARTFFLFLHDSGRLKDWYAQYTATFDIDPTGIAAIEHIFEQPIAQVERQYHAWVRALPQVAEQSRPGEATLGLDVDAGSGDGPVIVGIPAERRAVIRRAGLRTGDVITAVNGRPTRDLNELVRILGEHSAEEEVEISYRRRDGHHTARITLIPR
jgi:tetratricopeptide (TPR) repeat protein